MCANDVALSYIAAAIIKGQTGQLRPGHTEISALK